MSMAHKNKVVVTNHCILEKLITEDGISSFGVDLTQRKARTVANAPFCVKYYRCMRAKKTGACVTAYDLFLISSSHDWKILRIAAKNLQCSSSATLLVYGIKKDNGTVRMHGAPVSFRRLKWLQLRYFIRQYQEGIMCTPEGVINVKRPIFENTKFWTFLHHIL